MNNNTKALFQPLRVGSIELKNRIAMPPMDTNYGELDGHIGRKHFAYLTNRAKGGVGLIVVEATSVSWPQGKISERQLAMNNPAVTPDLRNLTNAVHGYGTKIFAQIHHGGFMAVPEYCDGSQNVSASDFNGARALTIPEIQKIEKDFVNAAVIAQKAGFDGVEVHVAHMYLLNQFLSPTCNVRTDEYGGSHENRFRIVKNIIEGIREACGKDFVIDVRLGAFDYTPNGNTIEDGVIFAKMAEEAGADMLNISAGFYTVMETETTQWDKEGTWLDKSEAIKNAVNIPVAVVGKLRTPAFCAQAVTEGKTDICMIGRQLICDPAYPNKVLFGREDQIRPCLNCLEGCLGQFYFKHGNVECVINPYVGYEDLYNEFNVPEAGTKKKILVVGGGIAAMQFAIIATKRGHQVTICEKDSVLGGQMILAGSTPFKEEVGKACAWYKQEVARLGVEVRLNTTVDADYIAKENPDTVVLAMGSRFTMPPIAGIEHATNGEDVLKGTVQVGNGKKAVVIGGGVAGCELAHKLILEGNEVTILEILPELCPTHEFAHRALLVGYLNEHATVCTGVKVTKINAGSVEFTDTEGNANEVAVDYTIISAGQKKMAEPLYSELLSKNVEVYRIGDQAKASSFHISTRSAFELAYTL